MDSNYINDPVKYIFNKYRDEYDSINEVEDEQDHLNSLYQEGGLEKVMTFFLPNASNELINDYLTLVHINENDNDYDNSLSASSSGVKEPSYSYLSEQERIEQCDLIDKYADLISIGNIYNLSFEQQKYIIENNLNAKYLLTFEQWNDKGSRIIKGSKAIRLPNKEPLFDIAQTNYKQLIDDEFPRLTYDYQNINDGKTRRFIKHFIKGTDNIADYQELLITSLINRFVDSFNSMSIKVVDDPQDINLALYSQMNKEMFNYIKAMYNELKFNDEVKFSDIVDYSLQKLEGDEYYDRNDTSDENENEIYEGRMSSIVSGNEGQWDINSEPRGNRRNELSDIQHNQGFSNKGLGEEERSEILSTAFSSESTNSTTSGINSERDSEQRNDLQEINNESDEDSSLFKSTQLSLFDSILAVEEEELHQEHVEQATDRALYVDTDINEFISKMFDSVDEVLKTGSGVENGKFRIYDLFKNHNELSMQDKAKLLAKEYGEGGKTISFANKHFENNTLVEDANSKLNDIHWIDYSSKGINFYYHSDNPNLLVKWNEVAKRIKKLITYNQYLSLDEIDEYNEWVNRNEYNSLFPDQPYSPSIETSEDELITEDESIFEFTNSKGTKFAIDCFINSNDEIEYTYYFTYANGVFGTDGGVISSEYNTRSALIDYFNENESDLFDNTPYNELNDIRDIEEEELLNYKSYVNIQVNRANLENIKAKETIELNNYVIDEVVDFDYLPNNYHIDDSKIGFGKPRERYQNNINAIKLLKKLESENRQANLEDQHVLAKYVGWGGLADAFDETKWPEEYKELKGLLTDAEYENARSSVNTAFFTQPAVIDTIYKALDKFGFKSGNILEPSCGIGNFFGRLPAQMEDSSLYGVELDNISAKIAQRLYPNASIIHSGFEKTEFDDNFFDVAIGNVPFGDYKVSDTRYDKNNFLIHDYFFAKTIDKVRPNGVIALVTSKGTMDKMNSKAREYIAKRCDLIGAIRLPKETFKGNAGTEAISDIIFLSKREQPCVNTPEWVHSSNQNFMYIDYFKQNMSKNELEEKVIQMLLDNDFESYKQLANFVERHAEENRRYVSTGYINENYYGDEGYYSRDSVVSRWKNHWSAEYGYASHNSSYSFNSCGNIELYKWWREDSDTISKIVADSGKFKSDKDRRDGVKESSQDEIDKARLWLQIGDESIEQHFRESYINPIVNELLEIAKDSNKVYNDNGDVVKEGMTMQPLNTYFANHKDMVVGDTSIVTSRFGYDLSVSLADENDLANQLDSKIDNLNYEYHDVVRDNTAKNVEVIKADLNIDNYSYGIKDNKIYYRTNSTMELVDESTKGYSILKDLISLRQAFRNVVNAQLNDIDDTGLNACQKELNDVYDKFVEDHGRLFEIDRQLSQFSINDSSLVVLSALENYNKETKQFISKADIFSERTIHKQENKIEHCDTSYDALIVSLQTRLGVDLELMQKLTDKSKDEILNDLQGTLYRSHKTDDEVYITADEYLSGNVKQKYKEVENAINDTSDKIDRTTNEDDISKLNQRLEYLNTNLEALKKSFPADIPSDFIAMPLGATWIPIEVYQQFMEEVIIKDNYYRWTKPEIVRSDISNHWSIEKKTSVVNSYDSFLTEVYGINTRGHNALDILETCLNLKTEEVAFYTEDPETGKKIKHVDKNKTIMAKEKQEQLQTAFTNWLDSENTKLSSYYGDSNKRVKDYLAELFNEKFNCVVDRKYNQDLVNPVGMAVIKDADGIERQLYPHQKEVIAKALFGGNTGIFHSVGAGKTLSMITIAMESKRLGLCNKSLFVCPKSIVGQWGKDFISTYPNANILVADEKSFSKENRQKFISKIATGNYDAIIISNDQFKLLQLSDERIDSYIQEDIDKITAFVSEQRRNSSSRNNWSVKQAEAYKKKLQQSIEKRHSMKKDDFINFEELGIDKLFIDESHNFKNLAFETQLSRVKGVGSSANSQKSNDLYYKTRYLNELTGNKGIVFASGTPVSNYLAELFTIQRYLQPDQLEYMGIDNFDSWVSVFAKIVEDKQLDVTGTKYQQKAMIKQYHNLPELMSVFRQVADIKTKEDMAKYLNLPQVEKVNVVVPRTDGQSEYLDELNERVDAVRNNNVDVHEDNMLKITTDGRKMALDQRLVDIEKPEGEITKADYVADNVYKEYVNSNDIKGTQFIFSDLSTPKDHEWDIYNDIKKLLIEKGIPANEIAFIHDYEKQKDKDKLFKAVNNGDIRVVIGSTSKLGTGVNAQEKAVALHHVDVPWKPSDIEQREGRIVRKGNTNDNVRIYRYVTADTFDAYSWQIIENKSTFISQIMKSETSARTCDDIDDEVTLDAAQVKAIATGNPMLKESMELENDIKRLNIAKNEYLKGLARIKENVNIKLPESINHLKEQISNITHDLEKYQSNKPDLVLNQETGKEQYVLDIVINNKHYTDYKEAGLAMQEQCKGLRYPQDVLTLTNKGKLIGNYLGFDIRVSADSILGHYVYCVGDKWNIVLDSLENPTNMAMRVVNSFNQLETTLGQKKQELNSTEIDLARSKELLSKPFDKQDELKQKQRRLDEINLAMEQASEYSSDESFDTEGLILYDEEGNIISDDIPANNDVDEFDEEKGYEK